MTANHELLPLEAVYRWERERPDRIFLTQPFGGGQVRHWTWAQAVGEARRMASYLTAQDWEPGSRVAILSKNCAWWIMADLAIWMSGHVSVPIYPSLRPPSIRQILEHSGARACFSDATEHHERELFSASGGITWISLLSWDNLIAAHPPISGCPSRGADDLATIVYTSGTTGAPKGVMHRFGAFAINATILARLLKLNGDQRFLSYLPLAHLVERVGVEAVSYLLGCQIFFTERVETFLQDLRRARPTLFVCVPRVLQKCQQGVFARMPKEKLDRLLRIPALKVLVRRKILRGLGLDTVHHAACGAAPLPPELLLWYRKLGLNLVEGYGMTETMITHLPHDSDARPGYVGSSLEGVETRVSAEGELLIRSPMNMLGYYKDRDATERAFTEDGFFCTGDLVALDPGGQIKIVGRIKEQFKTSKGKYVAPAPIESRLLEHPAVEACCVMGAGQPSPLAVVLLSDAARKCSLDPVAREALEESLRVMIDRLNAELEPYERLSRIVIADGPWTIENGLITPTLKIRRSVLENRYEALIGGRAAEDGPVVWESR